MDWDNLRIFLELARGRRLMDAAERLGVDYSTVSRRIRRFERELGTQLFDRNNQGYTLTAQGQQLVEYAETVEATVHQAQERLTGHNAALSGQIWPAGFIRWRFPGGATGPFLRPPSASPWTCCRCRASSLPKREVTAHHHRTSRRRRYAVVKLYATII